MLELEEFSELESRMSGDEDALALYELVWASTTRPLCPQNSTFLQITNYENLCGLDYDYIFALGLVDGLLPNRGAFAVVSDEDERQCVLAQDRKRFYAAISKARELLVLSAFSKAGIELAERSKMEIVRIKSENGERVAFARHCLFFQETGAACPSTTGGEDLLSELLLD